MEVVIVDRPIMTTWPASALQLHPHTTVVVDEAAASRLEELESLQDHVVEEAEVAEHLIRHGYGG